MNEPFEKKFDAYMASKEIRKVVNEIQSKSTNMKGYVKISLEELDSIRDELKELKQEHELLLKTMATPENEIIIGLSGYFLTDYYWARKLKERDLINQLKSQIAELALKLEQEKKKTWWNKLWE